MWTHDKPKEPGYYWMRGAGWDEHVVRIDDGDDGLEIHEHSSMGWEYGFYVDDVTTAIQWQPCVAP